MVRNKSVSSISGICVDRKRSCQYESLVTLKCINAALCLKNHKKVSPHIYCHPAWFCINVEIILELYLRFVSFLWLTGRIPASWPRRHVRIFVVSALVPLSSNLDYTVDFTNVVHVFFGLYIWELVVSCYFEVSLIKGKRKAGWPLVRSLRKTNFIC